jgi:ribonuclease HII
MRAEPSLAFERALWRGGLTYVAGMDEAGRGALAGPVAVGAVILPSFPQLPMDARGDRKRRRTQVSSHSRSVRGHPGEAPDLLKGVRDSKQMTPRQREAAVPHIKQLSLAWSVGFASPDEIDSEGIVRAVRLAALRALEDLAIVPDYLLTDFRLELPQLDISQTALVKGDVCCLSIAAASVLAKTARDALMREMDVQVPGYGLGAHKGYGTQAHRMALMRLGRSPIHRKTFSVRL